MYDKKLQELYDAAMNCTDSDYDCVAALIHLEDLLARWHTRVAKSVVNYHAGLREVYDTDPSWLAYYDWADRLHSRRYGGE